MKESKELDVKKENNQLAETTGEKFEMTDFMDGGLEASDVRLEKLVVVQSNSKIRQENKELREGDVYLSLSRNKVLSEGEELEFIPLYIKKLVQIYENETKNPDPKLAKKGKYVQTVNSSEVPKSVPWVDEGFIRQQDRSVFSCILGKGFTKTFPYRISFKSSSMKNLNPLILKVTEHIQAGNGNNPIQLVFGLKTKSVSNDKSTWYVPEVTFKRLATPEEYADALETMKLMKSMNEATLYNDADTESDESY